MEGYNQKFIDDIKKRGHNDNVTDAQGKKVKVAGSNDDEEKKKKLKTALSSFNAKPEKIEVQNIRPLQSFLK